jgi:hypothetical protein
MITCADKGKMTVIIYTHNCSDKVFKFLSENNFHTIPNDPSIKDHRKIKKTLQQCDKITDRKHIKYLIPKNPATPTINAPLKLHKPGIPIRPVINNTKPPHIKLLKDLTPS